MVKGKRYKKDVKFHFAQCSCRPLAHLLENNDKSGFIHLCIFVVLNMQSMGAASTVANAGLTAVTCCCPVQTDNCEDTLADQPTVSGSWSQGPNQSFLCTLLLPLTSLFNLSHFINQLRHHSWCNYIRRAQTKFHHQLVPQHFYFYYTQLLHA